MITKYSSIRKIVGDILNADGQITKSGIWPGAWIRLHLILVSLTGTMHAQSLDYYCRGYEIDLNDPHVAAIVQWIEPFFNGTEYPPLEVVGKLLSSEVSRLNIADYPCLFVAYNVSLAHALRDMEAYEEAERTGLIALETDSIHQGMNAGDVLSLLASITYQAQDYAKATAYYARNLTEVETISEPVARSGALNNLALSFYQQDSLARATSLFNQARHVLDSAGLQETHIYAAILDNLSDAALTSGDTTAAIQLLLRKDSILMRIVPDTARLLDTWMTLAELHLLKRDLPAVRLYLERARSFAESFSGMSLTEAYKLESLWFNYYSAMHNIRMRYASMLKLLEFHEAYEKEVGSQKAATSEALRNYANYNVQQVRDLAAIQIERLKQEQIIRNQKVYLWLSLGSLICICLVFYFYYRNKVNNQRIRSLRLSVKLNDERLRNEQLEKELLKKDLEANVNDLTSIAIDNAKRKEWTASVMAKLSDVLEQPQHKRTDEVKRLYYQLMHQNQIQERLSRPQENHELINRAFLDKLKDKYPQLTESEIDLCILLRLGLSGKEIAIVRNVDPESIRKAKYRLRKRMNLKTPADLREFLRAM